MSLQLAKDFFPGTIGITSSLPHVPELFSAISELIMLNHVDSRTPELELGSIRMFWPQLLPACIFGCLIGALGTSLLRKRAPWALSFMFFGMMNLSAAGFHCLTSLFSTNTLRWLYFIDCISTGCSSSLILLATLTSIPKNTRSSSRISTWIIFGHVLLGIIAMKINAMIILELVYVLPTGLCCLISSVLLSRNLRHREGKLYMQLAIFSGICAVAVLFLEGLFVLHISKHIQAVPLTFLFCDLGFLALLQMVRSWKPSGQKHTKSS